MFGGMIDMKKQRFMDLSIFVCPTCGKTFPIMRNHGQHRERGHIKDIWCTYCKSEQKFLEVRKKDSYTLNNGKLIYV